MAPGESTYPSLALYGVALFLDAAVATPRGLTPGPGGALVNSQGREPLECGQRRIEVRPERGGGHH
jgi:hypothetical protein